MELKPRTRVVRLASQHEVVSEILDWHAVDVDDLEPETTLLEMCREYDLDLEEIISELESAIDADEDEEEQDDEDEDEDEGASEDDSDDPAEDGDSWGDSDDSSWTADGDDKDLPDVGFDDEESEEDEDEDEEQAP